jgi:hypothetical protein
VVVNAYVNNAESKFNGPDRNQCQPWTRGILQRTHVVAKEHRYCGKEFKRKLEQRPVDHEVEFECKVYENGRVAADAETLRQLARYSELQIRVGTGLRRDTIRLIRHGGGVKRSTYERVIVFLTKDLPLAERELGSEASCGTNGLRLTCATLGAFLKYPMTSIQGNKENAVRNNKFRYFQQDDHAFENVADELGLEQTDGRRSRCRR